MVDMKENIRKQMGTLKVQNNIYPVYEGINSIGRDSWATILLKDLVISKQHAIISVVDSNTHLISDMKSANGTQVNKIKLIPYKFYAIEDHEQIIFGNIVCIYFKGTELQNSSIKNTKTSIQQLDHDAATQILTNTNNSFENIHDEPTQAFNIHEAPTQNFWSPVTTTNASIHDAMTQVIPFEKIDKIYEELTQDISKDSPNTTPHNIFEAATQTAISPSNNIYEASTQAVISASNNIYDAPTQALILDSDNIHEAPTQALILSSNNLHEAPTQGAPTQAALSASINISEAPTQALISASNNNEIEVENDQKNDESDDATQDLDASSEIKSVIPKVDNPDYLSHTEVYDDVFTNESFRISLEKSVGQYDIEVDETLIVESANSNNEVKSGPSNFKPKIPIIPTDSDDDDIILNTQDSEMIDQKFREHTTNIQQNEKADVSDSDSDATDIDDDLLLDKAISIPNDNCIVTCTVPKNVSFNESVQIREINSDSDEEQEIDLLADINIQKCAENSPIATADISNRTENEDNLGAVTMDDDDLLAPTQLLDPLKESDIKTDNQVQNEICKTDEKPNYVAIEIATDLTAIKDNHVETDNSDAIFLAPTQCLQLNESVSNRNEDDDVYSAATQILNAEDKVATCKIVQNANTSTSENIFSMQTQKLTDNFDIFEAPTQKLAMNVSKNVDFKLNNSIPEEISIAPTQLLLLEDIKTSAECNNQSYDSTEDSIKLRLSEVDTENTCQNLPISPASIKATEQNVSELEAETQLEVDFLLNTQKLYLEKTTQRPDNPIAHMFAEEATQATEQDYKSDEDTESQEIITSKSTQTQNFTKLMPIISLVDIKNSKITMRDIEEASTSKIKKSYVKLERIQQEPTRRSKRNKIDEELKMPPNLRAKKRDKKNDEGSDESSDTEDTGVKLIPIKKSRITSNEIEFVQDATDKVDSDSNDVIYSKEDSNDSNTKDPIHIPTKAEVDQQIVKSKTKITPINDETKEISNVNSNICISDLSNDSNSNSNSTRRHNTRGKRITNYKYLSKHELQIPKEIEPKIRLSTRKKRNDSDTKSRSGTNTPKSVNSDSSNDEPSDKSEKDSCDSDDFRRITKGNTRIAKKKESKDEIQSEEIESMIQISSRKKTVDLKSNESNPKSRSEAPTDNSKLLKTDSSIVDPSDKRNKTPTNLENKTRLKDIEPKIRISSRRKVVDAETKIQNETLLKTDSNNVDPLNKSVKKSFITDDLDHITIQPEDIVPKIRISSKRKIVDESDTKSRSETPTVNSKLLKTDSSNVDSSNKSEKKSFISDNLREITKVNTKLNNNKNESKDEIQPEDVEPKIRISSRRKTVDLKSNESDTKNRSETDNSKLLKTDSSNVDLSNKSAKKSSDEDDFRHITKGNRTPTNFKDEIQPKDTESKVRISSRRKTVDLKTNESNTKSRSDISTKNEPSDKSIKDLSDSEDHHYITKGNRRPTNSKNEIQPKDIEPKIRISSRRKIVDLKTNESGTLTDNSKLLKTDSVKPVKDLSDSEDHQHITKGNRRPTNSKNEIQPRDIESKIRISSRRKTVDLRTNESDTFTDNSKLLKTDSDKPVTDSPDLNDFALTKKQLKIKSIKRSRSKVSKETKMPIIIEDSDDSMDSSIERNTRKMLKTESMSDISITPSKKSPSSIFSPRKQSRHSKIDASPMRETSRRKYEPLQVTVTSEASINSKYEISEHKVIFTMLNDSTLENVVKNLGGTVVDSIKSCTVLVTNKISRSLKFLIAIALAKPIVHVNWILHSEKSKKFLDPWNYILEDTESEVKFGMSLKETLQRAQTKKLLSGETILLATNKNFDVLKEIIETSGGKCITRAPPKNTKTIVVCYEDETSKYTRYLKQKTATVVSAEAIFSGILQQKINWNRYLIS